MSDDGLKIIFRRTCGKYFTVRIEVRSFQDLLQYIPEMNENTVVQVSESCPDKDLEVIKAYCEQCEYVYKGKLQGGVGKEDHEKKSDDESSNDEKKSEEENNNNGEKKE